MPVQTVTTVSAIPTTVYQTTTTVIQPGALVFQADLSDKDPSQTDAQVMAAVEVTVARRINAYGITNSTIQLEATDKIVVYLPGVKVGDAAFSIIFSTANLQIVEEHYDASGNAIKGSDGNPEWFQAQALGTDGVTLEDLTGKYLKATATVVLNSTTNAPEVHFEWNTEGALLFKEITTRNLNKPIAFFLDATNLETATVNAVMSNSGVIVGLKLVDAQNLVIQLNSGSLAVPLTLVDTQ
jgi:preprotein translocase subunit SecD